MTAIIDVHAHTMFGIGDEPKPKLQNSWYPLTIDRMLELMDENNIEASILSIPESANVATGATARDYARRTNEALANIVAKHPGRFGAMATLPGRSMEDSVAEIHYAIDVLGMDGIATTTSINDVYLGEAQFHPLFQAARETGATVFVHPTAGAHPKDLGLPRAILEFMFDTTRMVTSMVLRGTRQKFADVKIISTHGGGAIPYLAPRIQLLAARRKVGPGEPQLSYEEIQQGLASFYYDVTVATSKAQIAALLELVPPSQLLMGFDMPFENPALFPTAITNITGNKLLSDSDRRELLRETALLLYPRLAARLRA